MGANRLESVRETNSELASLYGSGVRFYSHDKEENVFVGALRFKGENHVLAGKVASFVEVYGQRIPVSEIPLHGYNE
jgi:hypothetical protein